MKTRYELRQELTVDELLDYVRDFRSDAVYRQLLDDVERLIDYRESEEVS